MPTMQVRKRKNGNVLQVCQPARNNAFINRHAAAPHVTICWRGNTDFTSIYDPIGTSIYSASYASKTEAPDLNVMVRILAKNLSSFDYGSITARDLIRCTINALNSATVVGAPQVMYSLLNIPLVKKSRTIVPTNALPRNQIALRLQPLKKLKEMVADNEESLAADVISGKSHIGKRVAYGELVNQQLQLDGAILNNLVTFFALISDYNITLVKNTAPENGFKDPSGKHTPTEPPLLQMDGLYLNDDAPKSFQVGFYRFNKVKKRYVLHLTPYIPFDIEDDRSAFMLLLLHLPWPNGDESKIIPDNKIGAALHLKYLLEINMLSPHLKHLIQEKSDFQQALDSKETPNNGPDNDDNFNYEKDVNDKDDIDIDTGYDSCHESSECDDDIDMSAQLTEEDIKKIDAFHCLTPRQYNQVKRQLQDIANSAKYKLRQCNSKERGDTNSNSHHIPYDNRERLIKKVEKFKKRANKLQLAAFDKLVQSFITEKPIRMIVSGEGGTGKSFLIHAVIAQAQLHFGKTYGDYGPGLVLAPTGSAACSAGGYTWHFVLKKSKPKKRKNSSTIKYDSFKILNEITAAELQRSLEGVRIIFIDEMSMISLENLYDIDKRLKAAQTNEALKNEPFGGFSVVLCGDFYQLRPVGGTSLYSQSAAVRLPPLKDCMDLYHSFDTYIELFENNRYDDNEQLLREFAGLARKCLPIPAKILNDVNRSCIKLDFADAFNDSHPKSLWLAHVSSLYFIVCKFDF